MEDFFARHGEQISGVSSCFDRVVIMGSLTDICYTRGMAAHLSYHDVRLFDFPPKTSLRSWGRRCCTETSKTSWATTSTPASREHGSSTPWAPPRSRCTTNTVWCCASRPPPTT